MVEGVNLDEVEEVGVITDVGRFMHSVDSDCIILDRRIFLHVKERTVPNNATVEGAAIKLYGVDDNIEVGLERKAKVGSEGYSSIQLKLNLDEVLEGVELEEMNCIDVDYCPLCGNGIEDGGGEYCNCDNCGSTFSVR